MAGTIKFFDEMQNASNVSGQDRMMIGKAESGETQVITFDQAKQYLDITSNEIAPIVGGDSEDTATVVPAGPTGQTRRADVAPGWIDFGSGPIEAAETNRWMAYWDGSSWSLVDMGEFPVEEKADEIEQGVYLAPTSDAVWRADFLDRGKVIKRSASRNLFDKNAIIAGFLLNNDTGDIESTGSSGRNISEYIPVSEGVYYTAQGNSPNELNQRISVFENKRDTVAFAKMDYPTFQSPINGWVVIDVQDEYLDTFQIEVGQEPTPYQEAIPVATGLYEYDIEAEFAKKARTPEEPDDIVPLSYLDNITTYDVYKDPDYLFDVDSADRVFSSNSNMGFIRPLVRGDKFNTIEFCIASNHNTAPVINITIGTVYSVETFSPGDVTVLATEQISIDDLPASVGVSRITLPNDVDVIKDSILVILTDTPTAIPLFPLADPGYNLIYQTVANPNQWTYGYRTSSGIRISYENRVTKKFIQDSVNFDDNGKGDFTGLVVASLGDSITFHEGSWARRLFSKLGDDYFNAAVSGARFRNTANEVTSYNIYNYLRAIPGFWVNSTGIPAYEGRKISGFIDISANTTGSLTLSQLPSTRWAYYWHILDAGLNILESDYIASGDGDAPTQGTINYSNADAKYFVTTVFSNRDGETDNSENIQIEFGDTATAYEPYSETLGTEIDFSGTMGLNNRIFNQVLRLAQRLTPVGQPIVITNPITGEEYSVPTGIAVGTGDFKQPDLITISMGTNDAQFDFPDVVMNYTRYPVTKLDLTHNMVTAMMWAIEMLSSLCPDAQIIATTPIQASATSSRRYEVTKTKRDTILNTFNYYGIPVIDAFNESGISERFEVESGQGRYLFDGLHPDDNGKKLMAEFLGNRIKGLLNDKL